MLLAQNRPEHEPPTDHKHRLIVQLGLQVTET